jgi:hypothetical protein
VPEARCALRARCVRGAPMPDRADLLPGTGALILTIRKRAGALFLDYRGSGLPPLFEQGRVTAC